MSTRRVTTCALASVLFTLLVAGCARPGRPEMAEPVFYPPAPDVPRVQFLTSFSSAEAWLQRRSTFAQFVLGAEQEERGAINNPYGMAGRDGVLYICDLGERAVHRIDLRNREYSRLGNPQILSRPVDVTLGPDGTRYVCDTGKGMVAVFGPDDNFVRHIGNPEETVPIDLAVSGEELYVADVANAELEAWSKDGELLRKLATRGLGPDELRMPNSVAVGPNGHVFVTDAELATVKEYTPDGAYVKSIGMPGDRPGNFARPKGLAIDAAGHIYVADAQWEVVQVFSLKGELLLYFGGAVPGPHGMGLPAGLAIDDTSLDAFRDYVADDFQPQYLLFVVNQFGRNKIGVYAFGEGEPRELSEEAQAGGGEPEGGAVQTAAPQD
jgi:DNA-binding beta-propeller fold protein YncE